MLAQRAIICKADSKAQWVQVFASTSKCLFVQDSCISICQSTPKNTEHCNNSRRVALSVIVMCEPCLLLVAGLKAKLTLVVLYL